MQVNGDKSNLKRNKTAFKVQVLSSPTDKASPSPPPSEHSSGLQVPGAADTSTRSPFSFYSLQLDLNGRIGAKFRLLPGVVVQRKMNIQGMADLYRIKYLLECLIKSTIEPLRPSLYPMPLISATYWMAICLVSCWTETVLNSIKAIPCFNIYLYAVFTGWIQFL